MGRIHCFKEKFEDIIEEVLEQDVSKIDAHELGEVVDCLKDCAEAEYYCAVVSAMENEDYVKSMIPSDVRKRMYFKSADTFDDIVEKLNNLYADSTDDEKTSMKSELMSFVSNLV